MADFVALVRMLVLLTMTQTMVILLLNLEIYATVLYNPHVSIMHFAQKRVYATVVVLLDLMQLIKYVPLIIVQFAMLAYHLASTSATRCIYATANAIMHYSSNASVEWFNVSINGVEISATIRLLITVSIIIQFVNLVKLCAKKNMRIREHYFN